MFASLRRGPILIALAAAAAVIATLGPLSSGPGVTCDEAYHVAAGKRLVAAFEQQGLAFFRPDSIRANFPWPEDGPPVQGPLGHWILGTIHRLFDSAPQNPLSISVAGARFAPAVCFGLLVLVVGLWAERLAGRVAGNVAAVAVFLSPRLFAHAHLAALDMITTLFFVAALAAVAEAGRRKTPWHFAAAGGVWGLAVLVRLHGLLLLAPVAVWLVWQFRTRAWRGGLAWGAGGLAVVFAGWPWLWLAPIAHAWRYLASGADRLPIHVFYLGSVWPDRDAPWHYPTVMFLVTVPLGFLLLGGLGCWLGIRGRAAGKRTQHARRPRSAGRIARRASSAQGRSATSEAGKREKEPVDARRDLGLILGTLVFVLFVFSWPGVPVYDGVRLFLMVFPLWAIAVGLGARWLLEWPWLVGRCSRRARSIGLACLLGTQAIGVVAYHPYQLSYYNLLSGGLWGASRLGFEVSYWGDAVREPMLAEAVARAGARPIVFGPALAPFQLAGVSLSSPAMLQNGQQLRGCPETGESAHAGRVAVIYHRRADLASVGWLLREGEVVEQRTLQGVWLVRLVEMPSRQLSGGGP